MSLDQYLSQIDIHDLVERPVQNHSLTEIARQLKHNGAIIDGRIHLAQHEDVTRKSVAHIVGVERWGQDRL